MYAHVEMTPGAVHLTPYLDGEKVRYCFEANEEEGWVRCYVTENGRIVLDECGIPRKVTHVGRVELRRE